VRILVGAVLAGGAAVAAHWLAVTLKTPAVPRPALAESGQDAARSGVAEPRWITLPERETIGKPAGELFLPQSWRPKPPPAKRRASVAPPPPPEPAPPAMPYRVAGKIVHEDRPQIVLAKGNAVFTVREGDTLEDGYRVVAIGRDHLTLLYLPLGVQETLPMTFTFLTDEKFAVAESSPARLRWTGPGQVKAGDPFSVALKVSSGQAVRAGPLQLSYDAALLEAVDVRPGKFFVDGLFSYRINPEGSIHVGVFGKESVPADAELLVVTFKPIRAGATAELKISSISLQSAGGQTILHDHPAAFRTAIIGERMPHEDRPLVAR
jgi:hypothetical protein